MFTALALLVAVPAAASFELVAHLTPSASDSFDALAWSIADPESENYLSFLTPAELADHIGSPEETISAVSAWLSAAGGLDVRPNSLHTAVTASFPAEHSLLLTSAGLPDRDTHPEGVNFVVRRDARVTETEVDHPASPHRLASAVGAGSAYTIDAIKDAYNMPSDLQAQNEATTQMVWGPGSFGYSPLKLKQHARSECPLINTDKVVFDTDNHGESGGDNFGEGQLDVDMITSFGLNVTTIVSNTNTSASTEETTGFGAALLDFVTDLAARDTVPHVLSMSLGSLSAASCDLLCSQAVSDYGHTQQECEDYMATQRQVCMYLSQGQTAAINQGLQVLGTRGVTVLGSSGDGGSHFSFGSFSGGDNNISEDLNAISCKNQIPVFPTASPYILSIGGEMWDGEDSSKPITWAGYGGGSGSGFSIQFDAPEHQKQTVAEYLAKDGMPGGFDSTKRAYPDVSAVGVSGTSQSCPIFAGILSQIIDMRLSAGLPPLGMIGPRVYQVATQFPGEAFEDIVGGNSCTSCGEENGFPATEGWDANTGFGRPQWDGMVKHFATDA